MAGSHMNCDWTEKVSPLLDGELTRAEAAAVEAHLAGCAECRAARGEFLSLRRQLSEHPFETSPAAQRRALAAILASKSAGARAGGRRGGLLAALGLSPLRPAAASRALILLAFVGLALFFNSRRQDNQTARQAAPEGGAKMQTANAPSATPSQTPSSSTAGAADDGGGGGKEAVVSRPGGGEAVADAVQRRRPARRQRARAVRPAESQTVAERAEPARLPSAAVNPAERAGRADLTGAGLDASRHVEQAQLLLRSFRNARGDDDLAYERERSKRLLYRNIVLRRAAASQGDPVVESVLGRLEPILLDIANLPDSPASEDVNSIRERVRKKNLVVLLQAGVGKNY